MSYFPSRTLIDNANSRRATELKKALASASSSLTMESMEGNLVMDTFEQALKHVNNYITINKQQITKAEEAYEEVGQYLVQELKWNERDIYIVPQGSAATQTLIRSPRNKNFDIDAVCRVNIQRIDLANPVDFFNIIGNCLKKRYGEDVAAKNRCWNINLVGEGFYLEFTPSVPLGEMTDEQKVNMESMKYQATFEPNYSATALSVVDNKEQSWKPSNPEGFTQWVKETAALSILTKPGKEVAVLSAEARVDPVPDQEIPDGDILKLAIRLFKRHRDMCVYRNIFKSKYQPISVILVTLITGIYEGLATTEAKYHNV
ncbi:TPA: nucleotidyltransferase, partial [Candidatus Micrarchaeota archaeon]|nr:nucleotidyltransferase [Candidatus Micrarchaeota archaeon]